MSKDSKGSAAIAGRPTLVELGEVPPHAADPYPCEALNRRRETAASSRSSTSRAPVDGPAAGDVAGGARRRTPLVSLVPRSQAFAPDASAEPKPTGKSQGLFSTPPSAPSPGPHGSRMAAFGRGFPGGERSEGAQPPGPGFGAEPHRNGLPTPGPGLSFLLGFAVGVTGAGDGEKRTARRSGGKSIGPVLASAAGAPRTLEATVEAAPEGVQREADPLDCLCLRLGSVVGEAVRSRLTQAMEVRMADVKLKGGPVQKLTDATKGWKEAPGTAWEPFKLTGPQATQCKYVGKRVLDGVMYGVFANKKGDAHYARPMTELMR